MRTQSREPKHDPFNLLPDPSTYDYDPGRARARAAGLIDSGKSQPFKDPWELYERMRSYLGPGLDPMDVPPDVPDMEKIQADLALRNRDYLQCKDARKKQELLEQMEELRKDIQMRKFLEPNPDLVLRRRRFIEKILLSLCAATAPYPVYGKYSTALRCVRLSIKGNTIGLDQVVKDGVRILKDLPAQEVARETWLWLADQIQFSGLERGNAKIAELIKEMNALKVRRNEVYAKGKGLPAGPAHERLVEEYLWLHAQIERIIYWRVLYTNAASDQNKKFKEIARNLLVERSAASAEVVVQGLRHPLTEVRQAAGQILLRGGPEIIPHLLTAQEKDPCTEIAALFSAITGRALSQDPAAWRAWWDRAPQNSKRPAGKQAGAAPIAPPALAGAALPAPTGAGEIEELTIRPRQGRDLLSEAKAAACKARERHTDAQAKLRSLDGHVKDFMRKRASTKAEELVERELRMALAEASKLEISARLEAARARAKLDRLKLDLETLGEEEPFVRVEIPKN